LDSDIEIKFETQLRGKAMSEIMRDVMGKERV